MLVHTLRCFSDVHNLVWLQIAFLVKAFSTDFTDEGVVPSVNSGVYFQVVVAGESLATYRAVAAYTFSLFLRKLFKLNRMVTWKMAVHEQKLTLLQSEQQKLNGLLAVLSAWCILCNVYYVQVQCTCSYFIAFYLQPYRFLHQHKGMCTLHYLYIFHKSIDN